MELYYPKAIQTGKVITKGEYRGGHPVGAVVHWTSGWSKNGSKGKTAHQWALDAAKLGVDQGFCYFVIGEDGTVVQNFPINRWGYHCGKSTWPGLGSSLSNMLVGIEICCSGLVTRKTEDLYTSWFGEKFTRDEVRYSSGEKNIQKGYYHKYSQAQLDALLDLLIWLKANAPGVFDFANVLGHDEVSPDRKQDPGASLPMTMPEYREYLKMKYGKA